METALIVDTPASREAFTGDFQYYAPHLRFLNNQIISNLRFIKTQQQIDFNYPPHRQLNSNFFPIDSMTQIVHHLFPSPTGDYLLVNQTRDIIGITPPLRFQEVLQALKQNPDIDVWNIFTILFSRNLFQSAQKYIKDNIEQYNIYEFGSSVFKLASKDNMTHDDILSTLSENSFFSADFLNSQQGKWLKKSLRKNNLFNENASREKIARIKFLEGQIKNIKKQSKKVLCEEELQNLQNLSDPYLTPQDFEGYRFACALKEAFSQQTRGEYPESTLDRIIAVYVWQKANTPEDLPFLKNPSFRTTEETRKIIKSIVEQSTSLQEYYDRGEYDIVWSYIYRERLMLDAAQVPLIKYRSISIDHYSFSDCFETSLRNTTNYLCFQNGCFNPDIWKEHSGLRRYYNEFSQTNPNDPTARIVWANYASQISQVLYYTPSKTINEPNNTHEAIPGIFNMMRILSHLGKASEEILLQINQLYENFETISEESLVTLLSHLAQDITKSKINLNTCKIEDLEPLQNRSNTYKDYKGNLHFQITDQTPGCLEFQTEHALFRFQKSMATHTPPTQIIEPLGETLSKLPLFEDLKTEYMNKSNLLQSVTGPEEVTALLMRFDLQSPDIRREILPTLLEHHLSLSLTKDILILIEDGHDTHEITFVNNIFQKKIIDWWSNNIQREKIFSLMQHIPNIFSSETVRFLLQPENVQYSEWGLYLLTTKEDYSFDCTNSSTLAYSDPAYEYYHLLKNKKTLNSILFINPEKELFQFDDFENLQYLIFYHIASEHIETNTVLSKIPNWIKTLPQTLKLIYFSGHTYDSNYLPFALAIKEALEQQGRNSIQLDYSRS